MDQVGAYLTDHPVDCGSFLALNCLAGTAVPVGTVDLINAPHATMPLNNIQLAKQDFTPNCYGSLKFC
jgi:hypothetical protein